MYVGVTYARLVYSWYQNIFLVIAVLIVFHAANKKNSMKTILKQDSNSRQMQDIVPVSNLNQGISTLCCSCQSTWLIINSLPLLLLRCRCCRSYFCYTADSVAPFPLLSLLLLLRCHSCYHSCYHFTVTPAAVLLYLRCRSTITPLSVRCCSIVAPLPLLSLLLLLRCCSCYLSYCRSCCHLDFSRSSPQEA